MQARPRPSLDTNVSQYASHAIPPHSADSGTSSSTAPCDSATSSLADTFASLEDTRTADFASSVQEQASPALTHQRSRSHSVASHGSTISKNGVVYQEYYIAKYDYEPESSNYLPFSAGQLIKIIRKHPSGWWDGELAGRRGWFPSNYLYSDSSRLVRVRSDSLESTRTSVHSNSNHSRTGSNTSDEDDWMNVSFNDFLALQSDLSMRQPRDVPADLPFMVVMDRALCMVEVAALKKSLDHLAPFTACVIGIVRSVLSSAQCLSRDAPNLQRFPELHKARKAVLGELARLVGQTKKVGGEMEGEVELTHDEYQEELEKTMKISMTLFNNVQLFVVMCLDRSIHIQEAHRKPGLLDVVEEPDAEARTANAVIGQSIGQNGSMKRSPSVGPRSSSLAALRGAKSAGELRGGQVGAARNSVADPIKTARRARVIHGRGARSQSQSTTLGSISALHDMEQGPTEESSSSLSSLESSPFASESIAFPCGACRSTVVLATLRTVLDSLLGVTAAFIGHAQLHSRTSHPASKGTLIALTRQLVDLVRKLLTIVEAVVQHEIIAREKQREVLLLSQYKDTLYTSTNIAVDGVRELTNQPPTPSETEDQERAAVVAAVTDTLKLCAECGNAVRLCLSRKMGEEALIIWIPRLPGSPEPTSSAIEPGLVSVTIGFKEAPTPKGELRQRAKTTGGLRTQFIRDGEALASPEEEGVIAEEGMDEAGDQMLQGTAQDQATIVTAESTSGRPRGESGSSISTDATKLFEDEVDYRSRASSARTSGEPKALGVTEVDQSDETDAMFSTMANWSGFSGRESIPPTPLTPILDEKLQIPTPRRMQEERRPSGQHYLQRGDLILDLEGNIHAATFEALIERLTHPDERPDLQLMTHFLLTFRVFANPVQLADALIERWAHVSPPEESQPANFNSRVWDIQTLSIRARVVNFITEWTKIHWYPPTDIAALPKLLEFMKGETSDAARRLVVLLYKVNTPSSGQRGPSMEATKNKAERMNMLSVCVQHMDPSAPLSPTAVTTEVPRPSVTKSLLNNLRAKTFLLIYPLDFDPIEMARQLTIIENRLYSEIPMQEMIEKVDGRSVPHVKAVSDLSNAITGWITSHVLKEGLDLKKRATVVKFFLKVYKECIRIHNHATPVAILGALDSSPIRRLTQVWALLTPKYQEIRKEMQGMLNRDNNFSTYRRLLNNAKPPAVPFLGRYLGDVHFALEVSSRRPSLTDPTVMFINWKRYSQLGKILGDVCRFQQPFNLKEVPEVHEYLTWAFELSGAPQDADELQRLSLLIQPRERNDPRQNTRASDILGFARDLKVTRTLSAIEQL